MSERTALLPPGLSAPRPPLRRALETPARPAPKRTRAGHRLPQSVTWRTTSGSNDERAPHRQSGGARRTTPAGPRNHRLPGNPEAGARGSGAVGATGDTTAALVGLPRRRNHRSWAGVAHDVSRVPDLQFSDRTGDRVFASPEPHRAALVDPRRRRRGTGQRPVSRRPRWHPRHSRVALPRPGSQAGDRARAARPELTNGPPARCASCALLESREPSGRGAEALGEASHAGDLVLAEGLARPRRGHVAGDHGPEPPPRRLAGEENRVVPDRRSTIDHGMPRRRARRPLGAAGERSTFAAPCPDGGRHWSQLGPAASLRPDARSPSPSGRGSS